MTNKKHTIGTLYFELETYNKENALEIQNSVSRYGRKEIVDILEESLDRVGIIGSTAIVEKLEIDIGEISPADIRTNFLNLFRKQLNEKLSELHFEDDATNTKEKTVFDEKGSKLEILKQFLFTGRIPWYTESTPPDLQAIFKELVETKSDDFLTFIKEHLSSEQFVERMIYQFSVTNVIQLLETILKTPLKSQLQFSGQLFSAIKKSALLIVKAPYPEQLMLKVLIESLQIRVEKTDIGFEEIYINILAKKLDVDHAKLVNIISKQSRELKLKPETKKLLRKTSVNTKRQTKVSSKAEIKQKVITSKKEETDKPVSYYISNAGLTLLNPFLPELFRKLELLNKNEFRNEAAIHKAIHLSQYAVFKNAARPEYLLVLNKLICGYPLEKSVPIRVNMSRREKAETTRMVSAAIKHWSALKSTSGKGFRASFLQREGLLKPTENGWKLFIERKAYDILLDKIPWNYRIIKLPWMAKIIEVEW